MKDRLDTGILFSGPMVRAILEGRKTQTRRVVKKPEQVLRWLSDEQMADYYAKSSPLLDLCPYGKTGDRLWVRETWQSAAAMNQCHPNDDYVVYKATDPDWESMDGWKWRPSIFMPRWASRITLEITGVRVERLNDINEKDAIAEGYTEASHPSARLSPKSWYKQLWNEINGAGSWSANPWVWVVEFKRV